MENPYEILEERLNGIEYILSQILTKIGELDKPDNELFGNIDECSEWIKKSKSTIYKLISKRAIPHIKNGKQVLFRKDDIISWLNSGKKYPINELEDEVDQNLQLLYKNKLH